MVSYRAQHAFRRPEEIVRVPGFGKKRFDKLRPFLVVDGETTLQRISPLHHARSKHASTTERPLTFTSGMKKPRVTPRWKAAGGLVRFWESAPLRRGTEDRPRLAASGP